MYWSSSNCVAQCGVGRSWFGWLSQIDIKLKNQKIAPFLWHHPFSLWVNIYTEVLLCVEQSSKHWGYGRNQNKTYLLSPWAWPEVRGGLPRAARGLGLPSNLNDPLEPYKSFWGYKDHNIYSPRLTCKQLHLKYLLRHSGLRGRPLSFQH